MFRNEVLLAGKVLGDATQASERAPWKLTLTQGGGRKRDSEERYPVSYFNVVCWPDKCEGNAGDIKSGDFVEVTGKLRQRSYVDAERKNRTTFEIVADSVLVKTREEKQQQQKPLTPDPSRSLHITDADIPF